MAKRPRIVRAVQTRLRQRARAALTRSHVADAVELAGFALIVVAAFDLNFTLGLLVGGLTLVLVGNLA